MGLTSWRALFDGGDELVVGVDFVQGRTSPGLHTLASRLRIQQTFVETPRREVAPTPPALTAVDDYLGPWLEDISADRRPIRLVLGYCSGASVACVFADRLVERGAPQPKLVLLNPSCATKRTICTEFGAAMDGLEEGLQQNEIDAEMVWLRAILHDPEVDMQTAVIECASRYRALVCLATRRLNLEIDGKASIAEELADRFSYYLTYLAVTARLPLTSEHCVRTMFYSTDHDVEPNCMDESLKVDTGPAGHLLDDAGVARVVSELCRP